jgi:molybdopterin converting factor small subunit
VTVEILIFGPAAAAAKADRLSVTLPDGSQPGTAADVLHALAAQHPILKSVLATARLAVNHTFAKPDTRIRPGDELALIALVGGG